jgi:hypothetical protein
VTVADLLEQHLRAAFGYHAESLDTEAAEQRLIRSKYTFGPRHRIAWAAAAASGTVVAGGALAAILLISATPSSALAAWTRIPTKPTSAAVAHAKALCTKEYGANQATEGKPALAEARGRWVALIAVDRAGDRVGTRTLNRPVISYCIADGREQGSAGISSAPATLNLRPNEIETPMISGISGRSWWVGGQASLRHFLKLHAERRTVQAQNFRSTHQKSTNAATYAEGASGRGVSRITFQFANGRTVVATVENGYYFALWPWASLPTKVYITSRFGTQALDWPAISEVMGGSAAAANRNNYFGALRDLLVAHTSPRTFGGVSDALHADRAVVYVTGGSYRTLKAAVAHSAFTKGDISSVKVVEVTHSMQALEQVETRIRQDRSRLTKAGIVVSPRSLRVHKATNTVIAEVPDHVAAAQAYLDKKYGRGLVTVRHIR